MEDKDTKESFLVMTYLMVNNRDVSSVYEGNDDLFPFGWFTEIDIDSRCAMLEEAIKNKKKISETDKYIDYISDVKMVLKK
ncbi:MAG: hypothetical protein IKJ43_00570 [Bacilli bacterium]|nr:hypothetical protein [Bacilli bacterium]